MNKIYIIILLITIGLIGFLLYNKFAYLNIVVKFEDLEPFERQMNVYYKGFKVGKTTKIYPDENYLHTYLKVKIKPHNINLPNNIVARIKRNKTKEYISLMYPEAPTLKKIKNYDEIKGYISKDINSILNETIDENDVDEIIDETSSLIGSANIAIQNLNNIFLEVSDIINASRNDIKTATSNLAKTTNNLEKMSSKLNNSVSGDEINTSLKNIEETTENISKITEQINETTIPIINSIACDGKEITHGVKNTLKKRMGILKLMFGKPIKDNCN
ncbi:MAG: hypothetical protein IJY61_06100 [Candidatus Gastranaerophilales bacterium]|nr:hypothetical protein [Candidatus Gastranaerophilales bacterium]